MLHTFFRSNPYGFFRVWQKLHAQTSSLTILFVVVIFLFKISFFFQFFPRFSKPTYPAVSDKVSRPQLEAHSKHAKGECCTPSVNLALPTHKGEITALVRPSAELAVHLHQAHTCFKRHSRGKNYGRRLPALSQDIKTLPSKLRHGHNEFRRRRLTVGWGSASPLKTESLWGSRKRLILGRGCENKTWCTCSHVKTKEAWCLAKQSYLATVHF